MSRGGSFFAVALHQQLVRHGVDRGHGRTAMAQHALHLLDITVPLHQADSVHLARTVRANVLRQPECPSRALDVRPYRLPRPVARRIAAGKNPVLPALGPKISQQIGRKAHLPPLARLCLHDPDARLELLRTQAEDITHAQPGM